MTLKLILGQIEHTTDILTTWVDNLSVPFRLDIDRKDVPLHIQVYDVTLLGSVEIDLKKFDDQRERNNYS